MLGPNYKPPRRELIGGKYLDAIYVESWKEQMTSLLSEARIFGVTVFGDGATIKSIREEVAAKQLLMVNLS